MLVELLLTLAIPLGLDLYMPVPEDNPMTAEKIELGRQLFFDRRLSRDRIALVCNLSRSEQRHSPTIGRSRSAWTDDGGGATRRR